MRRMWMWLWMGLMAPGALAGDDPADPETWEVNVPHGPTHQVSLDLKEGTWMSV